MKPTLLPLLAITGCATIPAEPPMQRPVHTYSIVARDPATGQLGVAVQSHWFSVGATVPWAEAGVGAVATQSLVNVSFGPRGLELMRSGLPAEQALAELVEGDPGEALRQVALVDSSGRVAAHTGSRCIAEAGHEVGEGFSVQANMMLNDRVVPAMAKAWRSTTEAPFAERLLAALEAAQAVGGDIRGQQSAAILVVRARPTGQVWKDRLLELRVEDHPRPVEELRRLYRVHLAYEHMNAGDAAMERDDMQAALDQYAKAAELDPDNLEIVFWNAFTLANRGHLEEALPRFRRVFEAEKGWIELLDRLPDSGLIDRQTADEILKRFRPD